MTITYYGHCAFLWTSATGVRVLIDPFRNEPDYYWFLKRFPPVEADVVLVTHDHFDHNAVDALPGHPSVLKGPGEFRLGDARVRGVRDLHSGYSGSRGMVNTIFVLELDGVRYCHIGDNRHDVPDSARIEIGHVDVLMVTVDDSCHLLSHAQVDSLVSLLEPRVVVPMHYYVQGLTTETSTLKTAEGWLGTQGNVRRLDDSQVRIGRGDLPDRQEVWVLQPLSPNPPKDGLGDSP